MTDRLTAPTDPTDPTPSREAVELRAGGLGNRRLWARLLEGRYLEVTDRGQVLLFDLWASAEAGRAILWDEAEA